MMPECLCVVPAKLFSLGAKRFAAIECPLYGDNHNFMPPYPGKILGIRTLPCDGKTYFVIYVPESQQRRAAARSAQAQEGGAE